MSKPPYALLSDLHFHDWSVFSTINEKGVNSRLQITIDEVYRAADELTKAGGNTIVIAGDIFHTRGSVKPEVLNPVIKLFEDLSESFCVYAIPGNHDLSSKDTSWLTNAASALIPAGVRMANRLEFFHNEKIDEKIALVPWHSSIEELKKTLEQAHPVAISDYDLIIHAPVDSVISGLPDHGLTDTYLAKLNFKRIFSGHYHHHKDFGNGVYSIGATTHQTWGDVGSKAGFLLVYDNHVKRFASHAPSFVDIYGDMDEEELLECDGNYVRVRIGKATPAQVSDLRQNLTDRGAKGVVIQAVKETEISERETSVVPKTATLEQSVADYIGTTFGGDKDLLALCSDILMEVETVE